MIVAEYLGIDQREVGYRNDRKRTLIDSQRLRHTRDAKGFFPRMTYAAGSTASPLRVADGGERGLVRQALAAARTARRVGLARAPGGLPWLGTRARPGTEDRGPAVPPRDLGPARAGHRPAVGCPRPSKSRWRHRRDGRRRSLGLLRARVHRGQPGSNAVFAAPARQLRGCGHQRRRPDRRPLLRHRERGRCSRRSSQINTSTSASIWWGQLFGRRERSVSEARPLVS